MVGLDMVELTQEHRFGKSTMYCISITELGILAC
jgi:hypothetical protein